MIGSTIKVTATAENGNTFSSVPTAKVYAYSFEIEEASATKVNEITVTFANPVEAENVSFVVTKGEESRPIEDIEWNDEEDEAIITTSSKLNEGTYTVTATDEVTEDTDSADFEVEKQAVAEIVFLNETALTNDTNNIAYAYYDVKDQYGESMRSSASIQWSGSCKITPNKTNGLLKLEKTDIPQTAWVFNDKIYITGVYAKTGTANSTILTVGTKQALDHIEMAGFLKKGTSDIIQDLPADFKSGEYYLLFHAYDQNNCPIEAGKYAGTESEQMTFIPSDPLVVKELTEYAGRAITVDGVEYDGVFVTPGIKVSEGGEVTVTAIANKTGTKTDLNFIVGEDPVVMKFDISAPSGVVADGDTVEIPFEAFDEKGDPITNFRALAKQETFNTLSFNASEGKLTLKEADDGKAVLSWKDKDMPWTDAQTTDGIDRPISLTVVIVGGDPDNEMLYVQDKRRPEAIKEVNAAKVYVEGDELAFTTDSFSYLDQYGDLIDEDDDATDFGDDNDFFQYAENGAVLKGIDFAGYQFGIRITYTGDGKIGADQGTGIIDGKKSVIGYSDTSLYETAKTIKNVASGEGFKFEIVKIKPTAELPDTTADNWEAVSPAKSISMSVVDITQVKNFTIGDLNTFYIGKLNITGDKIINSGDDGAAGTTYLDNLKDSAGTHNPALDPNTNLDAHDGLRHAGAYRQPIVVTGTYGSEKVTIPVAYFGITSKMLKDENHTDKDSDNNLVNAFDDVDVANIEYKDLYDKTTANGVAKLAEDQVTATINKIYDVVGYWAWSETKGYYIDETMTATQALASFTGAYNAALKTAQLNAANTVIQPQMAGNDRLALITTDGFDAFMGTDWAQIVTDDTTAKNNAQTDATNAGTALTQAEGARDTAKAAINAADVNELDAITVTASTTDGAIEQAVDGLTLEADTTEAEAIAYLKARRTVAEKQAAKTAADNVVTSATNKLTDDTVYKNAYDAAAAITTLTPAQAYGDYADEYGLTKDGTQVEAAPTVCDKATKDITLSDQAPYAAKISGVKESYTFNPTDTGIAAAIFTGKTDKVKVLDQYGVTYATDVKFTVSNVKESEDGYAENNFKVTNNGERTVSIVGAERGDTFDLVISYNNLKVTTKVTVGADTRASIVNSTNYYTDGDAGNGINALKDTLETQRKAGLQ